MSLALGFFHIYKKQGMWITWGCIPTCSFTSLCVSSSISSIYYPSCSWYALLILFLNTSMILWVIHPDVGSKLSRQQWCSWHGMVIDFILLLPFFKIQTWGSRQVMFSVGFPKNLHLILIFLEPFCKYLSLSLPRDLFCLFLVNF